ncbi:hypothetical protein C0995_015426 [Termitomyces sp. Mi166|nr:hypothetical protein C0995_015426 [Termitomyces sp. Mi166\
MAPSSTRGSRPSRPAAPRLPMSPFSSAQVRDSGWASENFMLGAGMVIIQRSTHKIVIIYDTKGKYWFLPRGRKDVGESLETTALREAYEESGYRVTSLPLFTCTHAPSPPSNPGARRRLNTESLYTTITHWSSGGNRSVPGEYMTFWYAGQIPPDAVHETGTGMPNEQTYTSHLYTYQEAILCLCGLERRVLEYVWDTYVFTLEALRKLNKADEADANGEGKTEGHGEDQDGTEAWYIDQDLIFRENENTVNTMASGQSNGTSSRTIVDSRNDQPSHPPLRNPNSNPNPTTRTIVDSRIAQSTTVGPTSPVFELTSSRTLAL